MRRVSIGKVPVAQVPDATYPTITIDPAPNMWPEDFVRMLWSCRVLRRTALINTHIHHEHGTVTVVLADFEISKRSIRGVRQLREFVKLLPDKD